MDQKIKITSAFFPVVNELSIYNGCRFSVGMFHAFLQSHDMRDLPTAKLQVI